MVPANLGRMNAVNMCTAFHRVARFVQEARPPPDAWPPQRADAVGRLLSELSAALLPAVEGMASANLGVTFWSASKTHRLPQAGCAELVAALQAEAARRLGSATHAAYMSSKHLTFGPQALR